MIYNPYLYLDYLLDSIRYSESLATGDKTLGFSDGSVLKLLNLKYGALQESLDDHVWMAVGKPPSEAHLARVCTSFLAGHLRSKTVVGPYSWTLKGQWIDLFKNIEYEIEYERKLVSYI